MAFELTPQVADLQGRLLAFMERYVYPNENAAAATTGRPGAGHAEAMVRSLQPHAREEGLWNLFFRDPRDGVGLSNVDYAPLCEIMGRSPLAPPVFNCSAPDDGIMDLLCAYANEQQREAWLRPLLAGEIRACLAMTEPAVASSDATNIQASIARDGGDYVISGRKWYISNGADPRCKIAVFMGKTDPTHPDPHRQQSMVLVPMDAPGIELVRPLPVLGFDNMMEQPAELVFHKVRVPVSNLLLAEGRGFEIAQGGLGPMRIHHCMREVGRAERALKSMCERALVRVAFGKPVAEQGVTIERIAQARILIDQARLLTLQAAYKIDTLGSKGARAEVAMAKVAVPNMACTVIDWAIQAHGAAGLSNDYGLPSAYMMSRTLRIADGPDEVHRQQIGLQELRKYR